MNCNSVGGFQGDLFKCSHFRLYKLIFFSLIRIDRPGITVHIYNLSRLSTGRIFLNTDMIREYFKNCSHCSVLKFICADIIDNKHYTFSLFQENHFVLRRFIDTTRGFGCVSCRKGI